MGSLSSLVMNGVQHAEPIYENMTDEQISGILSFALEEALDETLDDVVKECGISDKDDKGDYSLESYLMKGVEPQDRAIMEVSIVKLDRKAKKQRSYKLAVLQCAKDDDNQDYKKLETIWRMEKFLFRKLEKKYKTRAMQRMKQAGKKASGSSTVTKRAKSSLTKSQRETKRALAGDIKPPSQVKSQFRNISNKLKTKI